MSDRLGALRLPFHRLSAISLLCLGAAALPAQPTWTQLTPVISPDYREASWMTWDPVHKNIVLFGGCSATSCPSNDTWVWDGGNGTQKFPALSPPARYRHAMLYDSLHQQVVLFGGSGANSFLNDTWVWDGRNWSQENAFGIATARAVGVRLIRVR